MSLLIAHFDERPRLPDVATIVMIRSRVELADRCRSETRYFISSARLAAAKAGPAIREDLSRLRKGQGAINMAIVRHFAINLVRTDKSKLSNKLLRKVAGWDPEYLAKLLSLKAHQLGFVALICRSSI
jgi:hypothetical protein